MRLKGRIGGDDAEIIRVQRIGGDIPQQGRARIYIVLQAVVLTAQQVQRHKGKAADSGRCFKKKIQIINDLRIKFLGRVAQHSTDQRINAAILDDSVIKKRLHQARRSTCRLRAIIVQTVQHR